MVVNVAGYVKVSIYCAYEIHIRYHTKLHFFLDNFSTFISFFRLPLSRFQSPETHIVLLLQLIELMQTFLNFYFLVVCFLLGAPTCLGRWNRQSVPKRRHINFRRRGITQKKAYNIQYTAKV